MDGSSEPTTLAEFFDRLIPYAIRCGLSISEYWDLTIGEIEAYLKVYKEDLDNNRQMQLYLSYQTALLTASFTLNGMNGKQPDSFYDIYPEYYTDEVKETEAKIAMDKLKRQMETFAVAHNTRRDGE